MVLAELADPDPQTGQRLNYLEFSQRLEDEIWAKYGDDQYEVQIIGFAKQMGDIGAGATSVMGFFALAFLLTVLAVYWYTRSWALTFLPLCCSLVSVVWPVRHHHAARLRPRPAGDPGAFLVFAIGVSHGVQQVNFISKEVCAGADGMTAARRSFLRIADSRHAGADHRVRRLRYAGAGANPNDSRAGDHRLGWGGLQDSHQPDHAAGAGQLLFRFDQAYVTRVDRLRRGRDGAMLKLGRIAETRNAAIGAVLCLVLLVAAVWQSQGRHVGHVLPGAPELHIDSRYNKDVESVRSAISVSAWISSPSRWKRRRTAAISTR